jgi:signal transduction histidine kinase
MRRLAIRLLCVLPLVAGAVGACHTVKDDVDTLLFEGILPDSIKQILATGRLTPREKMIAVGKAGITYVAQGQHDSAQVWLRRALEMPGGKEYQGGRFISNLATAHSAKGEYVEALKLYLEAIEENKSWVLGKSEWSQQGLNVLRATAGASRMYYRMGNLDEALRYALRARAIDGEHGWNYISPQYLYVLGSIYLERGQIDDARAVMRQVFELSDRMARQAVADSGSDWGMYLHVARGHEGLARVALAEGDTDRALEHTGHALDYAVRNGNPAVKAEVLTLFSNIHLARKEYAVSGEYAAQARTLHPNISIVDPDVLFNTAAALLFSGQDREAYLEFDRYAAQMRINNEKQFLETMAGMEVVYETEKREARISSLERQRLYYALFGVALFLLMVSGGVMLWQKVRNARKEKQLAAATAVLEWEKRERKRFASDLHDGINGMLSAIKLQLATTDDVVATAARLDECIDNIRRMARGMMPSSLERYGLRAALEDYCRLFPGVRFHFFGEEKRLDEKLELTIYYCTHELVGNSFHHAGASRVDVQLIHDASRLTLTVQDNGRGFDPDAVNGGSGLQNLRDRVASVGGRIDIVSRPGNGCEINIEINTDKL